MTDVTTRESDLLGLLKEQYEEKGYAFYEYPEDRLLPSELRGFRPDGLAIKGDQRILLELKSRGMTESKPSTVELARILEAMPNWSLRLIVADQLAPDLAKPLTPDFPSLLNAKETADRLSQAGFVKPAFISLWSLLEAIARYRSEQIGGPFPGSRLMPRTVISFLDDQELVPATKARELRELISLRNRIVHGDLDSDVSQEQLDLLVDAADHAIGKLQAANPRS